MNKINEIIDYQIKEINMCQQCEYALCIINNFLYNQKNQLNKVETAIQIIRDALSEKECNAWQNIRASSGISEKAKKAADKWLKHSFSQEGN